MLDVVCGHNQSLVVQISDGLYLMDCLCWQPEDKTDQDLLNMIDMADGNVENAYQFLM